MDSQKATGWTVVILLLLVFWWLVNYGLGFLHTTTTSVQSGIALPGGSQNQPTVTTCSGC